MSPISGRQVAQQTTPVQRMARFAILGRWAMNWWDFKRKGKAHKMQVRINVLRNAETTEQLGKVFSDLFEDARGQMKARQEVAYLPGVEPAPIQIIDEDFKETKGAPATSPYSNFQILSPEEAAKPDGWGILVEGPIPENLHYSGKEDKGAK